jgi:hypothetical protein
MVNVRLTANVVQMVRTGEGGTYYPRHGPVKESSGGQMGVYKMHKPLVGLALRRYIVGKYL